jgi:hypothetical protein
MIITCTHIIENSSVSFLEPFTTTATILMINNKLTHHLRDQQQVYNEKKIAECPNG